MAEFEKRNPTIKLAVERLPFSQVFQALEVRLNARTGDPDIYIVDSPLTASYADTDQFQTTLRTQLASGTGPDVFTAWPGNGNAGAMEVLAPTGYLADLSGMPWASQIPATLRSVTQRDGKTYILPISFSGIGAFYNKPALDAVNGGAAPSTWSEVLALCDAAKAHGKSAFALGNATPWITQLIDYALVPTLVAPHWVIRHAEAGKMPAYAIGKAKAVIDDHKASIKLAIESGVKIAFGTDTGVGPHGTNGEEFLLMRDLGMEPLDCIRAATNVAADTIGMPGVGRLDSGSWADLIGVQGDPLANLELVAKAENIRLVVKGGEVVKRL